MSEFKDDAGVIKDMDKAMTVEFVWMDAVGGLRSKTKIFKKPVESVKDINTWWFDGSSTGQATGSKSDVFVRPERLYKDPFRPNGKLVLCECFDDPQTTKPNAMNKRREFAELAGKYQSQEVWVGIEQEYVFFDRHTNLPLGWKGFNNPGCGPQGPYYCAVGGDRIFGRSLAEEHLQLCINAGVNIYGINSEVLPSQWEFQVGTGDALQIADDLIIARYILERVTEGKHAYVNYHPKPCFGDWNGSGGHLNFSTKAMRDAKGLKVIEEAMSKLTVTHTEDVKHYGEDNHFRLTGKHETSSMEKFSYGYSDRNKSVRITPMVQLEEKGYFEDRRPASNMNPYLVLSRLYRSLFENVSN